MQIVAEKIETDEHLAVADRYGFELRQGYALSRGDLAGLTTGELAGR